MRNVGMMLVVVLLVVCGSVAQAATTNPEPFNYTLTNNFESVGTTGWFAFEDTNNCNEYKIIQDSTAVNGTKVHYMKDGGGAGSIWYAQDRWGAKLDKTTAPKQLLSVDFYLDSAETSVARVAIQMDAVKSNGTGSSYQGLGSVDIANGGVGNIKVKATGGSFVSLPGATSLAEDTWYRVEMDHDYTSGSEAIRARYGTVNVGGTVTWGDGTTGDSWTDWQVLPSTAYYFTGPVNAPQSESVRIRLDCGVSAARFDNMSLIPEPATLSLLGVGGVLTLIRRKRR